MRFRAKFGAIGYFWVGSACLIALLWLTGPRAPVSVFFAVYFLSMASLKVLNHIFVYWDLDVPCLRERRLWSTREIPWHQVTRIGGWPSKPSSNSLEIDFDRPAPLSARGSIIANPEDRAGFLAALRKFASQADFEV